MAAFSCTNGIQVKVELKTENEGIDAIPRATRLPRLRPLGCSVQQVMHSMFAGSCPLIRDPIHGV